MATSGRTYRMHEFARLTGVTVRALRHYDRIGLLRPGRAANRYRVYVEGDRLRLEQILAFKGIGVPLSRIGRLLASDAGQLAAAFAGQRRILDARARRLAQTARLLQDAESRLRTNGVSTVPWRRLIEVAGMEEEAGDWRAAFATLQEMAAARLSEWSAAQKQEMGAEWGRLVADVQRSLTDDPAGHHGQQLAARWVTMLRRLYGADVPLSVFVTAGRHVAEWHADSRTPEFGKWPGFMFLSNALATYQQGAES